ncbi:hypothetical protein ZWY2020_009105 [Hordeum vulgare]|nr:hypothetical protein ZWY2020_009105 [Hordeum vulgare]
MADLEGIEFFTIILEKSCSKQNMKLRQAGNGLRMLWDMEVVFDNDGSKYLDHGWKQFVRAYDLRHRYFLVFTYDGNAMFTVKVFDTTMCRRRYQDDDDASTLCLNSEDEEEQSGEVEEQSRDDEVVADDGLAMVVVRDDDLAMVVVPDDDLAMVVVPDDGLAMMIPQLGNRTMLIVVKEYIP